VGLQLLWQRIRRVIPGRQLELGWRVLGHVRTSVDWDLMEWVHGDEE
jgi:hypothetical protein